MAGNRNLLIVIAVILIAILAVLAFGMTRPRTPSEKISDGLHDVSNGVGDAVKNATH